MLRLMKTHIHVSPKKYQTNINFSSHLATFVESFSKLLAHDNFELKEVHVASPHINSDNVDTPYVLIDDEKYYKPLRRRIRF